jgi:uncharacterized protein YraI
MSKRTILFVILALAFLAGASGVGPAHADGPWTAKYWNNVDLSGTPALERTEAEINYNWGTGSPGPGVNAAPFSALWTRTINVSGGTYRFSATADDGVRVWVDNTLIIDEWRDQIATTFVRDLQLMPGEHHLKMVYYNRSGQAVARLSWPKIADMGLTWRAEYYNNLTFSGSPVLVRDEPSIDYDWGAGSPSWNVVASDNFTARWTANLSLAAGRYRFTTRTDDGVRLWVNGALIIDRWFDQGAADFSAEVNLPGGTVPIRMEYYEGSGGAEAHMSFVRLNGGGGVTPGAGPWQGEYYNNDSLIGPAALVRNDAEVNFNWGNGSPAPNVIGSDSFSVRWTRNVDLPAGRYRFSLTIDDGARLWVNNQLVIDQWRDQTANTYTVERDLPGGVVPLRLEYFENGGQARVQLSWTLVSGGGQTITNWRGEYFNNVSLAGGPAVVRDDAVINFNWEGNAPAAGVAADNFSARWTRTIEFIPGRYRFQLSSDDGSRLWVNNQLVLDQWSDHEWRTITADIDLAGGPVAIRMEYYEHVGQARAALSWTRLGPAGNSGGTAVATVNVHGLNVRTGPGTGYGRITTLPQGTAVTLLGRDQSGTWVLVTIPDGRQGWMYASLLRTDYPISSLPVTTGGVVNPPAGGQYPATVTAFHLNVRQGPSTSFARIATVDSGTVLQMSHRNAAGTWVRVTLPNGTIGWVSAYYLQTSTPIVNLPIWN